jgi:hypothetical protein
MIRTVAGLYLSAFSDFSPTIYGSAGFMSTRRYLPTLKEFDG